MSIVGSNSLNLDLIFHIPYVIEACKIPSIMPSLSLTDMMYCTAQKKPTPASIQGVDF
jgi:hypothetical protein